jgi:hypothetical protein
MMSIIKKTLNIWNYDQELRHLSADYNVIQYKT